MIKQKQKYRKLTISKNIYFCYKPTNEVKSMLVHYRTLPLSHKYYSNAKNLQKRKCRKQKKYPTTAYK
jgi:hypothetical protein